MTETDFENEDVNGPDLEHATEVGHDHALDLDSEAAAASVLEQNAAIMARHPSKSTVDGYPGAVASLTGLLDVTVAKVTSTIVDRNPT